MRTGLAALLATLALCLAFTSAPARAQVQTPTDCSAGCYIITCNGQMCTLWRCDVSGCRYVTGWDRKVMENRVSATGSDSDSVAGPEVAYVSVCPPGKSCDLYEITATEALRLGSFDNVSDLVKYRQSMRGEAVQTK